MMHLSVELWSYIQVSDIKCLNQILDLHSSESDFESSFMASQSLSYYIYTWSVAEAVTNWTQCSNWSNRKCQISGLFTILVANCKFHIIQQTSKMHWQQHPATEHTRSTDSEIIKVYYPKKTLTNILVLYKC